MIFIYIGVKTQYKNIKGLGQVMSLLIIDYSLMWGEKICHKTIVSVN